MVACFVCAWFGVNWCVVLLDCACCVYHKRVGVSRSTLPAVLCRAPIDEAGFQPTDTEGPHNAVKSVLSMPKCSPVATARVSSPKDWAVLVGSHMQQEVVISFGATTSRRTCPQMDCASTELCKTQSATSSRRETTFAARDSTHISRSPGRPQRANARLKPEVSKLATITPHMRKVLAHACETRVLRPAGRPGRTCIPQVE